MPIVRTGAQSVSELTLLLTMRNAGLGGGEECVTSKRGSRSLTELLGLSLWLISFTPFPSSSLFVLSVLLALPLQGPPGDLFGWGWDFDRGVVVGRRR